MARETWQLELLVAGSAVLGLAAAEAPLTTYVEVLTGNLAFTSGGRILSPVVRSVVYYAWFFTVANLILSVLLRSLWVASLGVRSFSGGIELDGFGFAAVFERFLRRGGGQASLFAVVPISHLPSGRHYLDVGRLRDDSSRRHIVTVPFLTP